MIKIFFKYFQFQVKILSASPQCNVAEDDDDIDAALNDLQVQYKLVLCPVQMSIFS